MLQHPWFTFKNLVFKLTLAGLINCLSLLVTTWFACHQPWMGLDLTAAKDNSGLQVRAVHPHGPAINILNSGDIITEISSDGNNYIEVSTTDIIPDPDILPTFASLNNFLTRQETFYTLISSPVTHLRLWDGRIVRIQSRNQRPFTDLPIDFWLLNLYGVIAVMVGAWIYFAAKGSFPTNLLLVTGVSFLILTGSVSLISTRELAFGQNFFAVNIAVYHLGTHLFQFFIISLLWSYPVTLAKIPVLRFLGLWLFLTWLNEIFQWINLPGHNSIFKFAIILCLSLSISWSQWFKSKNNPIHRAIVKWLALSTHLTGGLGIVLYFFLSKGDGTLISLNFGLGMTLCMYFGFSLGVARIRLFDIDRWWLNIWLWFGAGAAILAIDALIVSMIPKASDYALIISLIFVGWFYFPFRQWLWSKAFPKSRQNVHNTLPLMVSRLITGKSNPESEWLGLLKEIFLPLKVENVSISAVKEICLLASGERMFVPALQAGHGHELCLADHGMRLFNPQDIKITESLREIVTKVVLQVEQYKKGVMDERERIMRDLHDDVGGRLLDLIHKSKTPQESRTAREALESLREVIYFSMEDQQKIPLDEAVARWRYQFHERLLDMTVEPFWSWPESDKNYLLTARQVINIGKVLQEAVNNALKHTQPYGIKISGHQTQNELVLSICNDGLSGDSKKDNNLALFSGKGFHNMKKRAEELGGKLLTGKGENDTFRVELVIPLASLILFEEESDHA